MGVRRIPQAAGLFTDPTALDVPEGALRRAENVLLHRPGLIQPRFGIGDAGSFATRAAGFYQPLHLIPFDGGCVIQSYDGSAYRLERDTVATVYTGDVEPPNPDVRNRADTFESRSSLYLTSSTGLKKLTGVGASALASTGVDSSSAFGAVVNNTAASGLPFAVNSAVAYRFVWSAKDANGYERRSAPSGRMVISYNGGSATWRAAISQALIPSSLVAGDRIEVYRSRVATPATATPSDEMFLAIDYVLTSADIANGYVTLADASTDASLGPALYTNASQLGILKSNDLPPISVCAAEWAGVAWYGNTKQRHTIRRRLYTVGGYSIGGVGTIRDDAGLQARQFTATVTNGSPTLTGVSSTTGLVVGMRVQNSGFSPTAAGTYFPIDTKILSINSGASTVTLTANATGSAAGVTWVAYDVVRIGGVDFYASDTTDILGTFGYRLFTTSDNGDANIRRRETALALSFVIGRNTTTRALIKAITDVETAGLEGILNFVEQGIGGAGFTLTSSRPDAWSAPLGSGGVASEAETKPHRLYYAKPDEPEAVPALNYLDLGTEGRDILALVPLRDALLVWKEDGLFRVTGSAPDGWSVYEIDLSLRLVMSTCVAVLDNVCYAWTDRGVVAASEAGIGAVVSTPIAAELRELQRARPLDTFAQRGTWMVAHRRLGVIVLAIETNPSSGVSALQYVYAPATGRWSTWNRWLRCCAYDPAEERMAFGTGDGVGSGGWQVVCERSDEDDSSSYYDHAETGAGTKAGNALTVATSVFASRVPHEGDLVLLDNGSALSRHRVTAVVDNGASYTITLDGTPVSGSPVDLVWYESIAVALTWQAQHLPGLGNRWQEAHLDLEGVSTTVSSVDGPRWTMSVGGATQRDAGPFTVDASIGANTYTTPLRVGLPRNCVRAAHFFPHIEARTAHVWWRLGELALHHTGTSRRVAR